MYQGFFINALTDFCSLESQTALLVAVTANQPDIVQDLLSLGADIGICDVNGQTALHLAATYGFPRVMQVRDRPFAIHTNQKSMPLNYYDLIGYSLCWTASGPGGS